MANRTTLTHPQETLEQFVHTLHGIVEHINDLDPASANWPLRLTLGASLYGCFDALRSQERPFDRQAFAHRLAVIEETLDQCPRLISQEQLTGTGRCATTEECVAKLYSRCWANYDDRTFLETVNLFEERFRLNQVELGFLKGAVCLDAGCGSGRYTLAMAQLSAKQSIGIDISERAVREARERSERLGFGDSVTFYQGSVLAMPQEWTARFDFVCSNGVVHHTTNPRGGLQELFRVLKPGGRAYVFVYGAGGLFWELVDVIRALVAFIPLEFADLWLRSLGVSAGKVFNYLDHWYTPIQERLTQQEFESRLVECGFVELRYMPRAKIYDASERRFRFPEERDLVGEGDLRYLASKPGS